MRTTIALLLFCASLLPAAVEAADKPGIAAGPTVPSLSYAQTRSFRELVALPRQADAADDEFVAGDAYAEALAQPLASASEARAEAQTATAVQLVPIADLGQPPRWVMLLAGGAIAVFLARRVAGASA